MNYIKLIITLACFAIIPLVGAEHHGAGVLPYYVDSQGTTWLFMGRERSNNPNQRLWADFGGARDPGEEDPRTTAAREGYEETRGVIGSIQQIRSRIQNAKVFKLYTNDHGYYASYFLKLNIFGESRISEFYDRKNLSKYSAWHFQEKDKLDWIRADDLLKSIQINDPIVHGYQNKTYPMRGVFFKLMKKNAAAFEQFILNNYASKQAVAQ
jgi:8-oxo-dGTP pyrophosphatase MutT (NUDIX family)